MNPLTEKKKKSMGYRKGDRKGREGQKMEGKREKGR
jgi:hypothetical protein